MRMSRKKSKNKKDREEEVEEILCFKKELLSGYLGTFQTFCDDALLQKILENLIILPRSEAEENFLFKQLIVYIIIKHPDSGMYLTYKRTPGIGEKKLRGKYSIGIGGHVNVSDEEQCSLSSREDGLDLLLRAVWREINEEIDIKSSAFGEPKLLCFINDDFNIVGMHHFGSVWLLEIGELRVSPKKGVSKIEFVGLSDLKSKKRNFERWSQLLIDFLEEML